MTQWRRFEWLVAAGVLVVSSPERPAHGGSAESASGQATIALEGTMKKVYRGANVVIVTTIDGVEHQYRFARDLVVHGGSGTDVSALEGLREGSTVVVHYSIQGAEQSAREIDVLGVEGLEATEAPVTRIDLGRGQITVRYASGTTDVFRLTERATAEADLPAPAGITCA